MKKWFWIAWLIVTLGIAAYYLNIIFAEEDKSELLIGESTYGHYQIELSCSDCHTDPFGGEEILQNACLNCHEEELENVFDSHPKKKFTNPRNADLIEILDARYCVSCHTEHQKEQTLEMGLTVPEDYCYHCHVEVGEERESHANLPFDSCASAGCHNYHDNRALYEEFLVENANQPWVNEIRKLARTNHAEMFAKPTTPNYEISYADKAAAHPDITAHWQATAHASAGVSCAGCHSDSTGNATNDTWIEKPGITQCQTCHEKETKGFTSGKHGMRLATSSMYTQAITPGEAHLQFNESALDTAHSCNSCHSAHEFDRKTAAVESCLTCHADEHSLAFENSKHAQLWQKEISGEVEAGQGVSCATCHMPRITEKKLDGTKIVHVEHNQNLFLRPNEKMIRPVCMQCHSLEFSIDALADEALIKNNFVGQPSEHIESIDWALKRDK